MHIIITNENLDHGDSLSWKAFTIGMDPHDKSLLIMGNHHRPSSH